jgi:hypothetical protein
MPGPWEARASGVVSLTATGANVVCEAPIHYLESRDHWQDNSRAIAQLPELLREMRELLEAVDACEVIPPRLRLARASARAVLQNVTQSS